MYDIIRSERVNLNEGARQISGGNPTTEAGTIASTPEELAQYPERGTIADTIVFNPVYLEGLKKTKYKRFSTERVNNAANPSVFEKAGLSIEKAARWVFDNKLTTGEYMPPSSADELDSLERLILHEVSYYKCKPK